MAARAHRAHRAGGQLFGERLRHLRTRAVAGAQEQHPRRCGGTPAVTWARGRDQTRMQRSAGARQQLAAAREIEDVVGVATVRRAAAHRDDTPVSQLAQVVRDEALAAARERAQLPHAPIAACQLAHQPPPQRMPREPQKPRRRTLATGRCGDHPARIHQPSLILSLESRQWPARPPRRPPAAICRAVWLWAARCQVSLGCAQLCASGHVSRHGLELRTASALQSRTHLGPGGTGTTLRQPEGTRDSDVAIEVSDEASADDLAARPPLRRRCCDAWSTCPECRDRRWTG